MKYLTALLIVIMNFTFSFGQKEDERLKEVFLDAEFFFLSEDYNESLANYLQIYRRGYQDNGNINYRIGQCYLNVTGEKEKAIPYLEKAVSKASSKYAEGVFRETSAPYDAYYYLGNAYRIQNQFDKAIANYETFKKHFEGTDAERTRLANQEIEACKYAVTQIKQAGNVYIQDLGRPVSTANSEIFPVISGDMNSLVYITKLKFYDALYFSRKVNGKWTTPVNITPDVQSDGDQYPTFISYDGNELYLRKEDNFDADLFVSKKVDGVWSKSRNLGKNINSKYWEGNLSISRDGKTLYFSSNRKEGSGAMDIYKSVRLANGEWGAPVNLGNVINTPFNDDAPCVSEDGTRLYFSSQGHQTMGGYDIFYCNIAADGTLSKPVNLGFPINTTDDDLYFYPIRNGTMAYMALNRKGNLGLEDIYEVHVNPDEALLASLKLKPKEQVVDLPETQADSAKTEPAVAEKPVSPQPPAEVKQPEPVQEKPTAVPVETPAVAATPEEKTIFLPVIFFDFNSVELGEKSKKSLDFLVTLIKNNGDFNLELTGHTDGLGSSNYNDILAEKRAWAVKNYLANKGLAKSSITVKSMGEKKFIAKNTNADGSDNPDGRKYNRRVEIRVMENKPNSKIVIEEIKVPESLKIEQP